ncbi:hypothetical protein BpHYR1_000797, partial [Brachionus plicatilis]
MGLWDILKAITHQEQESGITKQTSIAQITPCMNRCWCLINDNVLMSTFVAIITIIIMIMWTTMLSYKRQKNNNFTFVCNNQNNNATSQLPTALPVLSGTTAVSAAPTLSNRTLQTKVEITTKYKLQTHSTQTVTISKIGSKTSI